MVLGVNAAFWHVSSAVVGRGACLKTLACVGVSTRARRVQSFLSLFALFAGEGRFGDRLRLWLVSWPAWHDPHIVHRAIYRGLGR